MTAPMEIDFSYAAQAWQEAGSHFTGTAIEWRRPSVIFRPRLFLDGNKYCALFGENVQDGCGGFGDTPAEAMRDFDRNWESLKVPKQKCLRCDGTGAIDTPFSGSDPSCPECDGEGS